MYIGLFVACGEMLVVLEAIASYRNHTFWPSQVVQHWGRTGISFFAHGGMWGDLFLPILFAYILQQFSKKWDIGQILRFAFIGFGITLANHINLCLNQSIPDPLGWKEEWWSTTIALHLIYMTGAMTITGLFFFCSRVDTTTAIWVSILLGVHTMFGTHIPLGMLNRWIRWEYFPDFLASAALPYLVAGIWAALSVCAGIAAGWAAGIGVAEVATLVVAAGYLFIKISPAP